jgi:hypothetical protein
MSAIQNRNSGHLPQGNSVPKERRSGNALSLPRPVSAATALAATVFVCLTAFLLTVFFEPGSSNAFQPIILRVVLAFDSASLVSLLTGSLILVVRRGGIEVMATSAVALLILVLFGLPDQWLRLVSSGQSRSSQPREALSTVTAAPASHPGPQREPARSDQPRVAWSGADQIPLGFYQEVQMADQLSDLRGDAQSCRTYAEAFQKWPSAISNENNRQAVEEASKSCGKGNSRIAVMHFQQVIESITKNKEKSQ